MGVPAKKDSKSGLRSSIDASIQRAKNEQETKLRNKRMDYARAASKHISNSKPVSAAQDLFKYLTVLEGAKGVKSFELKPSDFNETTEVVEMLMVAGTYWDLVKLFDKIPDSKGNGYFQKCLERYILFSKGAKYQVICAETLRRFIRHGRPKHTKELKEAYFKVTKTQYKQDCFVLSSLEDVIEPGTVSTFQAYRDETLAHTSYGRLFIKLYYRVGPLLAKCVTLLPNQFRVFLAKRFEVLAIKINNKKRLF
jgi:hypothetical protein